ADQVAHMIGLLDVHDVLTAVTTADDVDRSKPDPEIFLTAMERGEGDPSCTIVIGDSTWDIEAASAARLPCVAVESGGFSAAELLAAGALAVYENVAALGHDLPTGPLARLMNL
ncbi:MAG: HAD-superfamily hydrolase, subfamily variant 3, partial [Ilumatobacteraceae bacterium]|nr:HAD-superfamily hydrolase, subfamily variant 3 [Ilumatobacteraceae bacterium]